jgi:hypothetical protein
MQFCKFFFFEPLKKKVLTFVIFNYIICREVIQPWINSIIEFQKSK